jgi:CheY-like chemotaxis protein
MAVILVIDDEAEMRGTVREALAVSGHTVLEAANGREGLDVVEKQPIDLIILDIVMPKVDGLEFMMQIRKTTPTIPIIAMSGNPHKELYAQTANAMGARYTLLKPFALPILIQTVNLSLAKERVSRSAPVRPAGENNSTQCG